MFALTPRAPALSAPQILALLETQGPKPLTCVDGECFAEFSSFCMEPGREGPDHDTVYLMAKGTDIRIIGRTADGKKASLPANGLARFKSQRGYTAVRISLPMAALPPGGLKSLAISVGRHAALLPKPLESHRKPHEPAEVAVALGPNRLTGEQIVDNGGARADGARLLSYMINALPKDQRVGAADRRALWRQAMAAAPAKLKSRNLRLAHSGYQRCLAEYREGSKFPFRKCLEHMHDHALWELNRRYWIAVKTGS